MEALTYENPTITVDGKVYKVQRLGLKHLFTFVKVLKAARIVNTFADMMRNLAPETAEAIANGEEVDPAVEAERDEAVIKAGKERALGFALELIFSLVEADADIYHLIMALTGMDKETAENLPLDVTVELVGIIIDAPDIRAFTKAVQTFINRKARPTATIPTNA